MQIVCTCLRVATESLFHVITIDLSFQELHLGSCGPVKLSTGKVRSVKTEKRFYLDYVHFVLATHRQKLNNVIFLVFRSIFTVCQVQSSLDIEMHKINLMTASKMYFRSFMYQQLWKCTESHRITNS